MPALTHLELPSTLTSIHTNYSLGGLTALQTLKLHNPVPVVLNSDPFFNVVKDNVTLQVPTGTLAAYDAADIWTDFINMEEFGEAAVLEVSANSFTVAGEGESVTVNVTASVDWEAAANFSWLTLSVASGSGDGELVLTAAPNTTGAERTAIVEVSGNGVESQIITVTQEAGAPPASLEVSSNSFTVAQAGESVTVNVIANVDWNAASDSDWLTLSAASGTGDGELILTAAANTGAERTAIVTLSATGVTSQTVTVIQSATMGNADFNKLNLQVYPNPATDLVTVSGLQSSGELVLVNINGSVVARQSIDTNGTFSVSSLPAGFYFARITSQEKVSILKIIKK